MNKEELLKAIMELPKIETDNPISTMNSINVDDLMSAVDRLNKVPDYNDLLEENQELKKQLEEWDHHLKCSKEMLDLQGHNGNYNYDSYMLGIYNGMEYIIALFETREPIFKSGKDIEFISDKTQQKDFISYLENEKNRLIHEVSHYYTDSFDRQHVVNEDVYDEVDKILNKFKEISGNDINVGSKGVKDER